MNKVFLYGSGGDYDSMLNSILLQVFRGKMQVQGIIVSSEYKYSETKDGFTVVTRDDFLSSEYEFDFIVCCTHSYFNECLLIAQEKNVPRQRVISGSVFMIPGFDFELYSNLINSPVSIISDDCWGGMAYNRLHLPFASPFVNLFLEKKDFIKLIMRPKYFLNTEMICDRETDFANGKWPVGLLGEGEDVIRIQFNHARSFADAKKDFLRRKERINFDNLFIKMAVTAEEISDELIRVLDDIKINKVIFTTQSIDRTYVYADNSFEVNQKVFDEKKVNYNYMDYVRSYSYANIDLLKLLNGRIDFRRT